MENIAEKGEILLRKDLQELLLVALGYILQRTSCTSVWYCFIRQINKSQALDSLKFHGNVAVLKVSKKAIDQYRRKECADTFEITKITRVCKFHF